MEVISIKCLRCDPDVSGKGSRLPLGAYYQLTLAKGIRKYQKWPFKALMTLAFKKGGLDLKCPVFRGSNEQRASQ